LLSVFLQQLPAPTGFFLAMATCVSYLTGAWGATLLARYVHVLRKGVNVALLPSQLLVQFPVHP